MNKGSSKKVPTRVARAFRGGGEAVPLWKLLKLTQKVQSIKGRILLDNDSLQVHASIDFRVLGFTRIRFRPSRNPDSGSDHRNKTRIQILSNFI